MLSYRRPYSRRTHTCRGERSLDPLILNCKTNGRDSGEVLTHTIARLQVNHFTSYSPAAGALKKVLSHLFTSDRSLSLAGLETPDTPAVNLRNKSEMVVYAGVPAMATTRSNGIPA